MWGRLVVAMVLLVVGTGANFNLYLSREEVLKLLGLDAELFYVTEGVVNTYALNFVVKVPAHISDIQFTWQSLKSKPLPYVLGVKYDGEGVLLPPQMNISSTGVIPTSVQTFWISLACTGLKSAQIEVQIQINVTTSRWPANKTSLNFRRNKICLQGVGSTEQDLYEPESLESSTAGSLYVGIASAIAMIGLILATASTICIKNNKKIRGTQEPRYVTAMYDTNNHVFIRFGERTPSAESGSYATIASFTKAPPSPSPYATSDAFCRSYNGSSQLMLISQDSFHASTEERMRSLAVPRATITLQKLLEEGKYGRVYIGLIKGQNTVMVKTVTDAATKQQVAVFISEGLSMLGAVHKNVLPILAVNADNPKQPLLVFPYSNKGNLKRFLLKCRQREGKFVLSTQNLVDMAIQILLGVMYLNSQSIYYHDLATRNCVLDENLQVRITDNCLSRDLFPDDYTSLGVYENLPVKWLAIETLRSKQYSSPSLVWSFGVVLWELTTLAQQPYSNIQSTEVLAYLEKGYRLLQPVGCPDELYASMACCWLYNPMERPTTAQLLAYLQEFYTALGSCDYATW